MLARLLQLVILGALALAAVWFWAGWSHGYPVWAAVGAAVIIGGYALVLALEFALLRLAHGTDPTPPASAAQLFRAWCGEVAAAPWVFCWRQAFRSKTFPDHLPADGSRRRGVLLLHGFVCNRGLWNPWLIRLTAQRTPVIALNLEPVFGLIDDHIQPIEKGMARLEALTGLPPIVLAHSMGGLSLRRWWAEPGNELRVHHAITLGSPHHGTWLARFALTRNARQMQLNSPWLRSLASRESPGRYAHVTCFYGHCDNIVFPPSAATLPGARNLHLAAVAHLDMADRHEPWQELMRLLAPDIEER